jgi:ADP-heptose:LPS heptosyltransferase
VKPVLLVLRALGIGDLAATVPALRALRRAFPRHELVLATPAALTPLVTATGAVDRVFATRSFVDEPVDDLGWSGPRPDIAVNLHGEGPQSHCALLATDPVRFIGYAQPAAGWPDGPEWTDDEHERSRWCRLLHWHGIPADPDDLAIAVPPPVPEWAGAVVVHPGASGPEKRWPVPRFAALAARLAASGHRILVSGSPGEAADAHALAAAAGLPPNAVLAGRTDIGALAALVAHARLLICGDTGVGHLATAYGTRSVLLFGPVPPKRWGPPPGSGRHTVLWRGPHGLAAIGVDEVYGAARAHLGATAWDGGLDVLVSGSGGGDVRDASATR